MDDKVKTIALGVVIIAAVAFLAWRVFGMTTGGDPTGNETINIGGVGKGEMMKGASEDGGSIAIEGAVESEGGAPPEADPSR